MWEYTFANCPKLSTVISEIVEPFKIAGLYSGLTFSATTFKNGILYVPSGTIDKYKETEGWKDFVNIKEGSPSAISCVSTDEQKEETGRYTIDGKKLSEPKKGLNIIRHKDGSVKKEIVK